MNIKHLELLAKYLESLPEGYSHFDMIEYSDEHYRPEDAIFNEHCGTAACAVGHAVYVKGIPSPLSNESWYSYSVRVFDIYTSLPRWSWCFGGDWVKSDNTPKGAAARIRYLIANPDLDGWHLEFDKESLLDRGVYHG